MRYLLSLVLVSISYILDGSYSYALSQEEDAWNRYQSYRNELISHPNRIAYQDYLSESLYGIYASSESYQERADLDTQLLFPLWLQEVHSHYESKLGSSSCLTVNGRSDTGEALSISMYFVREKGMLNLDDADIRFLQSSEYYPQEAICPEESRVNFQ